MIWPEAPKRNLPQFNISRNKQVFILGSPALELEPNHSFEACLDLAHTSSVQQIFPLWDLCTRQ